MSRKKNLQSGVVYSTDHGRMCPGCARPVSQCICQDETQPVTRDSIVRVRRETKGRKGKDVTVITGVPLSGKELKELGRQLKAKCGSGGTVKDGIIEIQGDHRDALIPVLEANGWKVKRAGG